MTEKDKSMKTVFNAAMQKAVQLTRGHNVIDATKLIRRALSGRDEPAPRDERSPERPALADPSAILAAALRGSGLTGDEGTELNGRPRRPLGEVLDLLRHNELPGLPGAKPLSKGPGARPFPVPAGAEFTVRNFACAAGARDYKLYVPSQGRARALPLILMLHGCTQNPDDFAIGTGMNRLAEDHGFVVAYPRQSPSANQSACWNWFNVNDQSRDFGEPSILAGLTHAIMADLRIDVDRVFVAGLSAGGAMAAILGVTYPDLYGAVGIHSGLAYKSANDLISAFAAMSGPPKAGVAKKPEAGVTVASGRVRTIVFHGAADHTVHPANAERIVAHARGGITNAVEETRRGHSAGGRAYKTTVIKDARGTPRVEQWSIEGMGHAWSGGHPDGSYTDPLGPDASREMVRFFLETRAPKVN